MRISGKYLIRRVYQGKRGHYADLVDLETGGDLRLAFPDALPDEAIMVPVSVDAVVEPRLFGRSLSLRVLDYTISAG